MIKRLVILVVVLILMGGSAVAEESGYGISLGYGEADTDIDIYRVGIKKDWPVQWLETQAGYVSGYFELSYNRWEFDGQDTNGFAFSPVFAYYFGDKDNPIRPYIEGGIGVTYIDEYRIGGRNLSTNFQFEDRIGAGVRWGFIDLNFRYMHYSNASIKGPNDGIDIFLFTTSIQF